MQRNIKKGIKRLAAPILDELGLALGFSLRDEFAAAMCKQGQEKVYRLVGTHRFGFNAFFMKNGVGDEYVPEVSVASCVQDPFSELARRERWPKVSRQNWEEV